MTNLNKPPEFAQLVDWLEGKLNEQEAAMIAAWLSNADAETQATVEWLRHFLQVSENVVLETPPRRVREVLQQRFAAYAQEKRPNLWQRLIATLSFDSWTQTAVSTTRAVDIQTAPRQLVYTTDQADIILHMIHTPEKSTYQLHGQLLPHSDQLPPTYAVQILQNEQEIALTATDQLGEFTFTSITPGIYKLIFSGQEAEIVISSLEIGP